MNKDEEIDKYLNREMSADELSDFENKLRLNKAFAEEVKLNREIKEALNETDVLEFHAQLESIYMELKAEEKTSEEKRKGSKILHLSYTKWYYAAASITLLFGIATLLFMLLRPSLNERLYSQYYNPYDASNIVRSDKNKNIDKFQNAIELYNSKEYDKSWSLLKEETSLNPNNMRAYIYRGTSAMEVNNFEDAIKCFQSIITDNSSLYIEQAEWYLALCYLKIDENEKAIEIFKKIESKDGFYKKQAGILLKDLSEL